MSFFRLWLVMLPNVFVYEKLRFCARGISDGNSEACKNATNFDLAKSSNFLYTLLAFRSFFSFYFSFFPKFHFSKTQNLSNNSAKFKIQVWLINPWLIFSKFCSILQLFQIQYLRDNSAKLIFRVWVNS